MEQTGKAILLSMTSPLANVFQMSAGTVRRMRCELFKSLKLRARLSCDWCTWELHSTNQCCGFQTQIRAMYISTTVGFVWFPKKQTNLKENICTSFRLRLYVTKQWMLKLLVINSLSRVKLLQVNLLFLAKTIDTLVDYTWTSFIKLTPLQYEPAL